MQLFLYEFITGGGMYALGGKPEGSLLHEGRAMLAAVVEDAIKLGAQPIAIRDSRLPFALPEGCEAVDVANMAELREAFISFAAAADHTLIIAPEFDGWLLKLARLAVDVQASLISPDPAFIALASNKQATAERLEAAGIPVPKGVLLEPFDKPPKAPYPAVIKPNDGAGSQSVRLVKKATEARKWMEASPPWLWRIERFHPGLPVSVGIMRDMGDCIPLAPFIQRLSDDGNLAYLGGERIREWPLIERAKTLAERAAKVMPKTIGYFGIDMVLGDDEDGSADVVIEVNPRLTTSYVGLRAICDQNLLQGMIEAAEGLEVDFGFRDEGVEFDPDGTIRGEN